MSDIRVRFAPSPTGQVHIGNIRAAIFNWLYARHEGGKFLLRVEDTDLERSTPEAIRTLLDVMQWLGLNYDEPEVYQTHNVKRHLECAEQLVRDGFAYRAEKPTKDGKTGEVVIFRMPKEGVLAYDDLVKGHMEKKAADTQDFVIVRSDGSPVFHLANVVDDIDQGITHVIRGDDREVLSRDEMVRLFTLEACHSSPAKFDIKKLTWMNGEYIRNTPRETFEGELRRRVAAAGLAIPEGFNVPMLVDQLQVRTKFWNDIPGNCAYSLTEDYEMDPKAVEKRLAKPGVPELLEDLAKRFEALPAFDAASTEGVVRELAGEGGMGPWVHPVRVAVSGRQEGPGLFEMLELLGREKTVSRLRRAATLCQ